MADNLGYTTRTRDIPIGVFLAMITGDIKNRIRTYGHKNCGLRHKELCEEINKIIFEKKKIVFRYTDEPGKKKLISEWESQKKNFFNNLFEEEGFINMCYPLEKIVNQSIYQLKSKHIQFCKQKDVKHAAVVANPVYSKCVEYNSWIDTQRISFTREYLINVSNFNSKTVNKSFSTKEHPGGHDPLRTYRKSKLDCEIYNPKSNRYQKELVEKALTNKAQLPREPNIRQGSPGKDGKSVEDRDTASAKTKSDVKKISQIEPSPDSLESSLIKEKVGSTANGQDISLKPKAPDSSVNRDQVTIEATRIKTEPHRNSPPIARDETPPQAGSPLPPPKDAKLTPAIQSVSAPNVTISLSSPLSTVQDTTSGKTAVTSSSLTVATASSLNSDSSSPSNSFPTAPVTKVQDGAPQSSTTSDRHATTHSNQSVHSTLPVGSSLPQPPVLTVPPAVTTAEGPGTFISSSASTVATTVTTTTAAPASVTISTMSITQAPIPSTQQAPSMSASLETPPASVAGGPKATVTTTEHQQTVTPTPTPLSGSNTGGVSVPTQPVTDDVSKQTSLPSEASSEHKDTRSKPGTQLSNNISQTSEQKPDKVVVSADDKLLRTIDQIDPMRNISPDQIGISKDRDQLTHLVNVDPGQISKVKPGKDPKNNLVTAKGKNDNSNIISEGIPPLTHIIPTFLVILATLTLLFQLYKYTPFGFLLGRRRKKKKRDLRKIFEITEKPTYESPNIAAHEWENPKLVGKTVENDIYIKLLKINRYKQEMQKRKKKNKITLIEVHMEVLEEYKNDEWELNKGDFLEICLHGFINEENETYQNFTNSELIVNNIKNEKTIEDIQKQEILWNNWIENHRKILEQWKEKEWFHILKNKWRNEQQKYKEKNDKLRENILNEQETHSIVSQKDIWKQWISKQATLIDMFNKEDWFKSMVYVQNKEKNNYHINEYNNISVISKTELKNEKMNHEQGRSKNIIQKLMVQINMMVLEECIKEDFIKHKELCIDNFIEDIHNQNNYDEKRNITQCDTDDFNVLEFEEINTSINK
ncbi:STP1 protein [Plasmodium ovale curtisi]|uniref:STP1 protein n=1 Tax=Plasmodium ovale curtisi TaxID=864141 RepID=A0A1A8WEI1_PLAOA|nr:STP1 protein [Plasmodium ovale curtisi]